MSQTTNLRGLTIAVWCGVTVLGATGIALAVHHGSHTPHNSVTPPYVPYTVTRANDSRDGNRRTETTFALFTNGDYVELIKTFNKASDYRGQSVHRTIATAEGLIIRIDDVAELKSTVYDADGANRIRLGDPRSDCTHTRGGAPLRFYDQRVIRREVLGGQNTVVIKGAATTRWHAIDLNCAVLKLSTAFGPDEIIEDRLVSVTPGSPADHLLQLPAHYAEVKPSGLGKTASTVQDDAYYDTHRPPAHLTGARR